MTMELFLAILPGLLMVAAGLVGAGLLLPQTLEYLRENRARKKAIKKALRVSRWIEGADNVLLRDVEDAATVFGTVYQAELKNGTDDNMALITAAAAVIANAREGA